ncbi:hypothetical protein SAMN02800692_2916 [Luteibacter sp. UNC138MFCol5.1]|nr:hypothetical protein SAMN02800692_2916 [Luteibacter sp. UNC138MFCol5.1]
MVPGRPLPRPQAARIVPASAPWPHILSITISPDPCSVTCVNSSPFNIDVDVQSVPGRGYVATYLIVDPDGNVLRKRRLARRFSAYSEAMACALDAAKGTVESLAASVPAGVLAYQPTPSGEMALNGGMP